MALKSKLASTDAATKAHLHKYQEGKEEVQDPETINPLEKSVDRTMTEFLLLPMSITDRNVSARKELSQKLGVLIQKRRKEMHQDQKRNS
ncbi:hypothetical protein WN943_000089 [Citrus x changshan-huyou]